MAIVGRWRGGLKRDVVQLTYPDFTKALAFLGSTTRKLKNELTREVLPPTVRICRERQMGRKSRDEATANRLGRVLQRILPIWLASWQHPPQ